MIQGVNQEINYTYLQSDKKILQSVLDVLI